MNNILYLVCHIHRSAFKHRRVNQTAHFKTQMVRATLKSLLWWSSCDSWITLVIKPAVIHINATSICSTATYLRSRGMVDEFSPPRVRSHYKYIVRRYSYANANLYYWICKCRSYVMSTHWGHMPCDMHLFFLIENYIPYNVCI